LGLAALAPLAARQTAQTVVIPYLAPLHLLAVAAAHQMQVGMGVPVALAEGRQEMPPQQGVQEIPRQHHHLKEITAEIFLILHLILVLAVAAAHLLLVALEVEQLAEMAVQEAHLQFLAAA
jgi:hypothetical protein